MSKDDINATQVALSRATSLPLDGISPSIRERPPRTLSSPARRQSRWSAQENALIVELRGGGLKWEEVSRRLPGRSAISCRLHYQNYLERRSDWDELTKDRLARSYDRLKGEMWSRIAEELGMPWRAVEAMHWQLGERGIADRLGSSTHCTPSTMMFKPERLGHQGARRQDALRRGD